MKHARTLYRTAVTRSQRPRCRAGGLSTCVLSASLCSAAMCTVSYAVLCHTEWKGGHKTQATFLKHYRAY